MEEASSANEKGGELEERIDKHSNVEAEHFEKFDKSSCERMFIPSFGLMQKRKGDLTCDSTKRLLEDAISIHSSENDQSESMSEYGNGNSPSATKQLKIKQICHRHLHKKKSKKHSPKKDRSDLSKGKQRDMVGTLQNGNGEMDEESFHEEISSELFKIKTLGKCERQKIDNCIISTIQILSKEVCMKEKEVLLRACKLMLTCKQSFQEKEHTR